MHLSSCSDFTEMVQVTVNSQTLRIIESLRNNRTGNFCNFVWPVSRETILEFDAVVIPDQKTNCNLRIV